MVSERQKGDGKMVKELYELLVHFFLIAFILCGLHTAFKQ